MEDAWAHGGDEGRGKLRKARGSGTHALIPRWPNGATRRVATPVIWSQGQRRTQGTETSQYLEEEKSNEMPLVAASERGHGLNRGSWSLGVVGSTDDCSRANRSPLEWGAKDGESPVDDGERLQLVAILSNARLE